MATKLENNEVYLEDVEKSLIFHLLKITVPSIITYEEYTEAVKAIDRATEGCNPMLMALTQSTLDSLKQAL